MEHHRGDVRVVDIEPPHRVAVYGELAEQAARIALGPQRDQAVRVVGAIELHAGLLAGAIIDQRHPTSHLPFFSAPQKNWPGI
jgi:hypothetical protein